MSINQPAIFSQKGRSFAALAVALQAVIVNEQEQILLLNSPTRNQGWQTISGGLEAGETILDGIKREVAEEVAGCAGTAVRRHPRRNVSLRRKRALHDRYLLPAGLRRRYNRAW